MANKSLSKNAALNTLKSLMSVIFPLVTFPYVSRVLGVVALGKYNFSYSVNSFFLMISMLGITSYAVREGAALRDDRTKINIFASQIYTINLISSTVAYILILISLLLIPKFHDYYSYILIFSIEIFFTTIGVEWIYIIYEEYAYITFRRIAFQTISMFLLFLFVKDENDVAKYCTISVIANAGANILNVFNLKKYCDLKVTKHTDWHKHIKPILVIFASTVAIKIYTSSDTVMLGFFRNDYEVGLYSVAVKIYNVLKTLLSAISIVAIPRLSTYASKNDMSLYSKTAKQVFSFLIVFVFPAIVGLFILSKNVIILLSGTNYLEANLSLKLLSIAVAFSVFSSFYNQCILIPMKLEKKFLVATVVCAFINILLNFVLIPFFGHNGAAFTTLIAEFISMVMCYLPARKIIRLKELGSTIFSTFIGSSAIMLICLLTTQYITHSNIICILVSVLISLIIYALLMILLKNPIATNLITDVRKKVSKVDSINDD